MPIKCFESSKYLSVNFDNKLNFKSLICIIENKVARSVGILSKLSYQFPSSLFLLYFSLIHPHLLFGVLLWRNAYQSYLNRLLRLQNETIGIITDSTLSQYHKLGYVIWNRAKIWKSIRTEIRQLTFHKFKIEYKKKLLESYC